MVWNARQFLAVFAVMASAVIMMCIAAPYYRKSTLRARERVLRDTLLTLRQVIHEYSFDRQKAPAALEDLVSDGYLRHIPIDPITGSNRTWRKTIAGPGIFDVHSGSDKISLDGTKYSDW